MSRLRAAAAWIPAVAAALWAVARVFGLERTWYGVSLMAFTPWVAIGSILPLAVSLALRRWIASAVAAAALLTLAACVLPRGLGGPDAGPGPRLVLMSSNMEVGAADPATITALVRARRVDVVAFQEITRQAVDGLVAAGLADLLPYRAVARHSFSSIGSAIWSRYPLSDVWTQHVAGGFNQEHAVVRVPGGQPFELVSVHARAPSGQSDIPAWWRSLAQEPGPRGDLVRVLAGDFNATLDHAAMRRVVGRGYRDVADTLGDGLITTWPYDGRGVPRIAIDHVLVDPRVGAVAFDAYRVPGTDHRAVIATVTLPPSG